jgi:hypothetical protein
MIKRAQSIRKEVKGFAEEREIEGDRELERIRVASLCKSNE